MKITAISKTTGESHEIADLYFFEEEGIHDFEGQGHYRSYTFKFDEVEALRQRVETLTELLKEADKFMEETFDIFNAFMADETVAEYKDLASRLMRALEEKPE